MNRHARSKRKKGTTKTTMTTNVETNDKAANVAEQGALVAPEKATSKKGASQGAPMGKKKAKGGKAKNKEASKKQPKASKKAGKPERKATAPRAATKGAKILEMIGRSKGATLAEIMKATAWQAHSVRGFLSIAGKKQGLKIESTKTEDGERLYKIAK
jgi:hypothetical protein